MATPLHLTSARGRDQSDVDERNFIPQRILISPRDKRALAREAKKRGVSAGEVLRRLIRSLETRP